MKKNTFFSKSIKQLVLVILLFVSNSFYSQSVLIIGGASSPETARLTSIRNRLLSLNTFSSISTIALTGTGQVTLSQLQQHDAVMVFTNSGYSSSWGLDAMLRDYVNTGGGVAVFMFANASIPLGSNWPYAVLSPAGQSSGTTSIGVVDLPTHPSLNYPFVINTATWSIGNTFSSTATTLTPGSYSIFKFSDGRPGLQAKENVGTSGTGRVIDLAIWPDYTTNVEADRLIANVLTWLMGAINVNTVSTCLSNNQFNFSFVDNISANPVTSYLWNFGDGSSSTSSTPTKSFATSGTFNITLTITRQDNSQSTFGTSVNVDGINIQPSSSLNICQNASTGNILTSQVTGQNISYQWFSNSSNSNSGGTSLGTSNGAQTSSLTIPTSTIGNSYYYLEITNSCGTSKSNVSTVSVNSASVAGVISAQSTTVCNNSPANLSITGNTGNVQWQSSPNNSSWTNISGATSSTLTSTNLASTTYFRAIVTSGGCSSVTTNTVTISIISTPTITLSNTISTSAGLTSVDIPYTAVTNSPITYSVASGTNALANFTAIVDASFSGVSGNLALTLPANTSPGTYDFNVTVKNTSGCSSVVYPVILSILAPPPTITSFSPTSAQVGETVTITGTRFSTTPSNNIVFFGSTKAVVNTSTATQLEVSVPKSAMYGPITVVINGAAAVSTKYFNIINTSISPSPSTNLISSAKFANAVSFTSLSGTQQELIIGAGDFDSDGLVDVVKGGSNNVAVHRNLMSVAGTITTSSLATSVNYGVSGAVLSLVVVDINCDGKLDIVSTSSTATSILINNTSSIGTITFANKQDLSSSGGSAVKVGDVDLDGLLDIYVLNNNIVKIYRNTGSMNFNLTNLNLSTTLFDGLAIGDLNNDGKNDIIVSKLNTLETYLNTSTSGSVSHASVISLGAQGRKITLADLDNDGDLDIFTSANPAKISRNDYSSGNFSTSSFTHFSWSYDGDDIILSAADLNGNNQIDIIGGTSWDKYWVADNRNQPLSATTFSNQSMGNTGATIGVDIDGDNKIDLVNSNRTNTSITIRQNLMAPPPVISASGTLTAFTKCSGTVSNAQTFTVSGSNLTANLVVVAYANLEYSLDGTSYSSSITLTPTAGAVATTTIYVRMTAASTSLISGNFSLTSTGATTQTLAVTGTVNPSPTITLGTVPALVPSATSFSIPYTAVTNSPTAYSVSAGTNVLANFVPVVDAAFSGATGNLPVNIPANSAPGTYDFNVKVKIGTTSCESIVYNVSITILQPAPTITSFSPTSATVGTQVIITGTGFSTTPANNVVFFGPTRAVVSAATTTSLTVTVPSGATHSNLVVLNSDNSLIGMSNDFFTPVFTPSRANILSTDYAPRVSFAGVRAAQYIAVGDLDGDGKPDLAIGHNTPQNVITVYRNTSSTGIINSSSFAPAVNISVGSYPGALSLGDLDGDGKLDIVVCNGNSSSISILRNISTVGSISTSSFSPAVNYATGAAPVNVALRDIDNDGKLDITVANKNSNTISIFKNNATIGVINANSFLPKIDLNTPSAPFCVTYGDLDGDGKSELISSNGASGTISVYRNISTQGIVSANSFDTKFDLTTGTNPRIINLVDIDGDGKLDITVTNNGANTISIIKNISTTGSLSSSSFQAKVDFSTGTQPYGITAGDINGDGKPDLAVSNVLSNTISVYKNTTSNSTVDITSLATKVDYPTVYNPNAVIIADLDSENKPELLYTNYNDSDVSQNVSILKFNNFEVLGSLTSFSTCLGSPSAAQTLTIQGDNLSANIVVAALTGYEYSLDNITYSSTVTITPVSGTVAATTLYIRLTGVTAGTPSGTISISCLGTTTQTRVVSGTVSTITSITVHPSNTAQSVCQGTALTALSVSASGSSLTYQWYSNTTATTTGSTLITGATGTSYTPVSSTPSELYYYCVVTGTCGTVTSNISALRTVSATAVSGTASSADASLCSGGTTTLSLAGSTGTIQWQQSANGTSGWANVSGGAGATTASYTTPALTSTIYYRAVVTSGVCTAATSNVVTVSVTTIPAPTVSTPTIQSFTTLGATTWTAPAGVTSVEYLVVGGGGGGANGFDNGGGGGGGAGMVLTGRLAVSPGTAYPIAIGDGGNGGANTRTNNWGVAGENTVFSTVTALGGDRGRGSRSVASAGAAQNLNCTAALGGGGSGGGNGGKGGGGAVGSGNANSASTGGTGGTGRSSSITGTAINYGIGGNGGSNASASTGANGLSNRGNGGNGGSAGSSSSAAGGKGGSGIVVLKYATQATSITYCEGETALPLQATATAGYTLQWYTVATGGTASTTAPTPNTSVPGTTTYYVSQLDNTSGCESARIAITVTVNALPSAPTTAATVVNYCQGATASPLNATASAGNSLQWYEGSAILTACAPTPITTTLGTTIYNVSQISNAGCESPSISITVTINAIPTISGVQNVFVGGNALQLTGSGNPAASSAWSSSNTAVATISSTGEVTAVAADTTVITYTTLEGCSVTARINVIDCNQPFGNALNFDGINDFVILDNVGNNSNFTFSGTSQFTLEAWVNRAAATTGEAIIIAKHNGAVGNNYLLSINAAGFPLVYRESNAAFANNVIVGTTAIPLNEWHHIAAVYNGTNLQLYVDGILNGSTSTGSIVNNVSSLKVTIGASYQSNNPSNFFNGSVDEARIWNIARTASQIQQSIATSLQGNETGLVAYYDFNQGLAGGNNIAITTAVNKANSTLNGTLTNLTKSGTSSNFITSTISDFPIIGNAVACQNATTQFTHPIAGGTWSVSNGADATVSNTGLLTTMSAENIPLTYTYTINGCTKIATKAITVVSPLISGATTVGAGETISLTATTTAANSNAWVSSNPAKATVSASGVVTGLATGTTIITFTNNNACTDTALITIVTGTTLAPTLTSPATNTTGATTLNIVYSLPEAPLAGSVTLTFTPVGGGTPIVWTMNNATSANFNYVVGTNPVSSNVTAGAALGFTTYDVMIAYQDAFSNPSANDTNTNVQTLAPPLISFVSSSYATVVNSTLTINTINTGGSMETYSISPALPTGFTFNTTTGVITGSSTVAITASNFTVTATNAAGTSTATVSIAITADTDGDGIPDIADADVNGDGVIDNGPDTDGDGIIDLYDNDIDGDGIPNNLDNDADGDGVPNSQDVCAFIPNTAITVQPSTTNQVICPSATISPLTVTATGPGLSYQWYRNTTATTTGGTILSGATSASYSPLNTVVGTAYYYVVVTGTCGTATSNVSGSILVTDITLPTVVTQNRTIYLNASGQATITAAQIDNGSTDNCAIATRTLSQTTFNCNNVGANTVTLTVTDASGNIRTGNATVTVVDSIKPTVVTQNITVNLNASGQATITAAQINNGSSDNCGIASVTVNQTAFTCANTGANTVTLTVTDVNGNVKTKTATVTVVDNILPTVVTQNVIRYLNASGQVTVTANDINNGSTDNCGIGTLALSQTAFTCAHVGVNTVTLTVTDTKGNTATGQATVTIIDNTPPTAIAQNINAYLNAGGAVTVTPNQVGGNSTDNCSIATMTLNNTTFNCSNLGANPVILTVVDPFNNVSTANAVITVVDSIKPLLTIPADITVNTNSGCGAFGFPIGTASATDNCSVISAITNNAPTFYPVGITNIVYSVTDGSGNTKTKIQKVTVIDNVIPIITAPANITTTLTAGCTKTGLNIGTPVTSDNCTIASVTNNAPTAFPVGTTTVTWTVTDASGNTATATQTVTVTDAINPTITAPAAITVNANASCVAFGVALGTPVTADNCTVASVTNNAPAVFPLGITTVTWIVTDGSGNTATATQTVTVVDNTAPLIFAPAGITVNISTGCTVANLALGTPVTMDNCSTVTVSNNAPTTFPIGVTTVTWTATDGAGNTATATQVVTIVDNTDPTIVAPAAVTANLTTGCTATGIALGTPTTADNCTVASVTNNAPTTYPIGTTIVTWTVTDGAGNTATATQLVTISDNTNPTITAPAAITATTNAGCTATGIVLGTPITADNCSVASVTNNAPTVFPIGTTTITWVVTDGAGNATTATQLVTITDAINPTITAPVAITVTTNSGCEASGIALGLPITADNCTVASVSNNAPATFPIGTTTVTWTVTDASGNTSTATQTVTVIDNINPSIIAPSAVTFYVSSGCSVNGVVIGTPVTADNCTVASVTNNAPATFPIGSTTVTWTVTDGAGNSAVATQVIQVIDTIAPTALVNDVTVALDLTGTATVTSSMIDAGSFDNCGLESIVLSQSLFGCNDLGTNVVQVTITDSYGNSAIAFVKVTITPSGIDVDMDGIDDACDEFVNTQIVQVPSGFSPNGDNINDTFVIPALDQFTKVQLQVYNKYGHEVYVSSLYKNDWDGTSSFNGLELPDDTYFYILNTDGELRQGYVYINRIK